MPKFIPISLKYLILFYIILFLIKEDDRQGVIEYLNDSKKSYLMNYSVRSLLGSSIQSEYILERYYDQQEDTFNNHQNYTFTTKHVT